jgi:hypothetical protein
VNLTPLVTISAKVFADSFPEPFVLKASLSIEARQSVIKLKELLPEWEKLVSDDLMPITFYGRGPSRR